MHVSRPVCNYRHRKICFGNFLNAVSQQPDNSIKCNVALLGFLFRLLPILNYVIKWWKSQALLETRYTAILYGTFSVSKFKTSHQTCYFSIQIFNPVIKTWSSSIQIWYPSILISSSSIKVLVWQFRCAIWLLKHPLFQFKATFLRFSYALFLFNSAILRFKNVFLLAKHSVV